MAVRIQRLCCVGARAKMRTRSVLSCLSGLIWWLSLGTSLGTEPGLFVVSEIAAGRFNGHTNLKSFLVGLTIANGGYSFFFSNFGNYI